MVRGDIARMFSTVIDDPFKDAPALGFVASKGTEQNCPRPGRIDLVPSDKDWRRSARLALPPAQGFHARRVHLLIEAH